jgi:hypothetical protein
MNDPTMKNTKHQPSMSGRTKRKREDTAEEVEEEEEEEEGVDLRTREAMVQ